MNMTLSSNVRPYRPPGEPPWEEFPRTLPDSTVPPISPQSPLPSTDFADAITTWERTEQQARDLQKERELAAMRARAQFD